MELQATIGRSLGGLAAAIAAPRRTDLPEFPGFGAADADAIAQELDLYVRAAETGQRGEPARKAKPPDPIESAIAAAVEERARDATAAFATHLEYHDANLRRTFLSEAEIEESESASNGLVEDLANHIRDTKTHLLEFWQQRVEAVEAEFQAFRVRYSIERPPKLVGVGEKLVRCLLLALLPVLAIVLHGRLLGDRGDGLGRMLPPVASAVAALVLGCWYARYGIPGLVGHGFRSKLGGVTSTIAFVGVVGAIALLAGHHCELSLAGRATLGALWQKISTVPLGLEASRAWLLVGASVATAILVTIVAVGMDDVLPGYGRIGRDRAAALEAYKSEVERSAEELATIQSTAEDDVRAMIEAVQERERESAAAASERSSFHGELLDHLGELAAAHEQLCNRYREINRAVQNGRVPAYFEQEIARPSALADPALPSAPRPVETWDASIERLRQRNLAIVAVFAEARWPQVEVESAATEQLEVETAV